MDIRYKVEIPKPSADRLKPVKLVVRRHHGFSGTCHDLRIPLYLDEKIVTFISPFKIIKLRPNVMDAPFDEVIVFYQNENGSRTEEIEVFPEIHEEQIEDIFISPEAVHDIKNWPFK
jgi:hypothetical protein